MKKLLSEMTLEELWELFPIKLTKHQPYWQDWYQEEERNLLSILPDSIKINHIGSTAICGIWAKPIIDILVETNLCDQDNIKSILLDNEYICMAEAETRIDFNKGYTSDGFAEKIFHLHLREFGDNDELYFRDYLNENPDIAKEYEKLKLSLWSLFEHDRDKYTENKAAFVYKYTQEAIKKYGKIY